MSGSTETRARRLGDSSIDPSIHTPTRAYRTAGQRVNIESGSGSHAVEVLVAPLGATESPQEREACVRAMATAGFGLVGGSDTGGRSRSMGRRTGSQHHGPSSISMRRLLFLALLLALLRPCPAPPINPGAQNEELKLPIVRDTIKVSSARSIYRLNSWLD